jgi:F5/8 type C domain
MMIAAKWRQAAVLQICLLIVVFQSPAPAQRPSTVTVTVDASRSVNQFSPARALGAGVDGHEFGETLPQLSPGNVAAMRSAGLKPLSYRLRTELGGEAWHWNPRGRWSDTAHRQGYWTSDSKPAAPIRVSYGYRLPRRGNTIDQANDDGYSRIDDGDLKSFWKSNPYLDEHFTGEKNSIHPQWLMIDLDEAKPIDTIKIVWAEPFATRFVIQYGDFVGSEDLSQRLPTEWHTYPHGEFQTKLPINGLIKLADSPIQVRYIRLRLEESSGIGPRSRDIRDRLGFAIREIFLGTTDAQGRFHDVIDHGRSRHTQTDIYVSSTDPWHRAIDIDRNTEQPGFDFIFRSGLTNGLPALVPVPVLYDTPENGAAEIRYLSARGYPIDQVELGEEPDGQFVDSEHFAELYLQFVDALRPLNAKLKFGGPSMQDIEMTQVPGRIEFGKGGWIGRFVQYLKDRQRLSDFAFVSFEWYPFTDDCYRPGAHLQYGPVLMQQALKELQQGGLPADIPWIISEYGYSAFGVRAEIDVEGALVNADSVARFLTLGGDVTYLYGYEPSNPITEEQCSVGNNMMFFIDRNGHAAKPTAAYWGARMLSQDWVEPGDQVQDIFAAGSDLKNDNGEQIVTAYAVHRPDGLWSLMLVNKDPNQAHEVNFVFRKEAGTSGFVAPLAVVQYSSQQYQLTSDRDNPRPLKSDPPARFTTGPQMPLNLPPYSLTVVRGAVNN